MPPIHLPDTHKYHPKEKEKVIAIFKNHDCQKRYDFLEITIGTSQGLDVTYWKDAYSILDANGNEHVCCPGLLYPRSLTVDEVWSRIAERLGAYVFPTPPNWRPDREEADEEEEYICLSKSRKYELEEWCSERDYGRASDGREDEDKDEDAKAKAKAKATVKEREREYCVMCADRRTYWAVSPPVFLSRHSRRWHVHVDCLQTFLPRRQFGLKPIDEVEYI